MWPFSKKNKQHDTDDIVEIAIKVDKKNYEVLKELQAELGFTTLREFINFSINITSYIVDIHKDGKSIAVGTNKDNFEILRYARLMAIQEKYQNVLKFTKR